jgi:hypothetical protein
MAQAQFIQTYERDSKISQAVIEFFPIGGAIFIFLRSTGKIYPARNSIAFLAHYSGREKYITPNNEFMQLWSNVKYPTKGKVKD